MLIDSCHLSILEEVLDLLNSRQIMRTTHLMETAQDIRPIDHLSVQSIEILRKNKDDNYQY